MRWSYVVVVHRPGAEDHREQTFGSSRPQFFICPLSSDPDLERVFVLSKECGLWSGPSLCILHCALFDLERKA